MYTCIFRVIGSKTLGFPLRSALLFRHRSLAFKFGSNFARTPCQGSCSRNISSSAIHKVSDVFWGFAPPLVPGLSCLCFMR